MFTITIQGVDARDAITELLRAGDFYRANPSLSAGANDSLAVFDPAQKAAEAVVSSGETTVKPARVRPPKIAPAVAFAAPAAEAPAAPPPAEAPEVTPEVGPAPQPEPAVTIVQARAFLSPYLAKAELSPKVVEIIKRFSANGRLSEVAESDLPKLMATAKTELEAA